MAGRIPTSRQMNQIISRLDGVQLALDRTARGVEGRARTNLAAHRKTGAHQILVTRGRVDRTVWLVGPAAMSVEVGHHTKSGNFVEGIHVLRKAAREG